MNRLDTSEEKTSSFPAVSNIKSQVKDGGGARLSLSRSARQDGRIVSQKQIEAPPGTTVKLIGRDAELQRLSLLLDPDPEYSVVFLHGIAGIGKTTLLAGLASTIGDRGGELISVDCRTVEPTERGFLGELAEKVHSREASLAAITERVGSLPSVVILALDNYEVFRLMDTWLRQVFATAAPPNLRLILCGRQPPAAAWLTAPHLEGVFRSVSLGPLDDKAATQLFSRYLVTEQNARRLNLILRGHPLAIRLAASTLAERPDLALEDVAAHRAVEELTNMYLADVDDPLSRRALEAASCLRRVTWSLLQIMLPDVEPDNAFARIKALPFVETRADGLVVHEAVREAVASSLRATDPRRYRSYRRAAWLQLKREVHDAGTQELWRYTSDLLYMIENPVVREAFFPTEAQSVITEPARAGDSAAIEATSERHDGPEATALLKEWWKRRPDCFSVIRDRDGVITGFFYVLDTDAMIPPAVPDDPIAASWWQHLRQHPVPKGQLVLGFRRWLDLEWGELPCAGQAASWLDVKRTYMQLRPALRRIYVTVRSAEIYWPIVEKLGFRLLPPADGSGPDVIGEQPYANVVLDFGPGSVDGWLAGLVAAELGVGEDPVVDDGSHELVVEGKRVSLTPLEFGVLRCLGAQAGKAVSRAHLLEQVWGYDFEGETNVVNVVVSSLRQKCGPHAPMIETIRGVGYRLRQDWQELLG